MSQIRRDKKAVDAYLKKIELIRSTEGFNPEETRIQKEQRIEKAKSDVAFFVRTYLSHYASAPSADFQINLARRVKKNKRHMELVRWGRGLAKSVWCDLVIPLWLWLNGEDVYVLLIGVNETAAQRLLSDLQAELEANPRIIHDFGEQKLIGSWEDGEFITRDLRLIGKALGVGQKPRGLRVRSRRPNYIVGDDLDNKEVSKNPRRVDEYAEWILRDLLPTMDGEVRRFLMPNNFHHPVSIQESIRVKRPSWRVDRVDAYDPVTKLPRWKEKYDPDYYRIQEGPDGIGILASMAEFNNTPHIEGKIFKAEQIQWVGHGVYPNLNHMEHIVGHWDVAYAGTATADCNAVRIWGVKERNFYHIASFVEQCKMRSALLFMSDFQAGLPKSVIINWQFESQFWNDEVERTIDEVESQTGISLRLVRVNTPKTKKMDRIMTLASYYQNGRIYFHEKDRGSNHVQRGNTQLFGIEPGYNGHDDAPDADEQAISLLSTYARTSSFSEPVFGERSELKNVF